MRTKADFFHIIFLYVFIACHWTVVGCNPVGQIIYDAGTDDNGSLDAGADKDCQYSTGHFSEGAATSSEPEHVK